MAAGMTMGLEPRHRQPRHPLLTPLLVAGGIAAALLALWFFQAETVTERPNDMKTTRVILPPPPPPPPPEPIEREAPPEPTPAPPLEQPQEAPPPPEAASEPVAGDSALTAREGAGPSNYGLRVGDGSGTRIGTRAGGDNGFAAYAGVALSAIRLAAQSDRELARGRYIARLLVTVDPAGRITDVHVIDGSGDSRRDARLRQVLTGLQLSRRPPAGLPAMRIELNAGSGA